MKSPNITAGRKEKTTASWIHGVNSIRNPWALPQDQLKWGVNVTIRGGIAQTRPGFDMRLSLPPGNFQGGIFFSANKQNQAAQTLTVKGVTTVTAPTIYNYDGSSSTASELPYVVFAVSGKVYFSPFPLTQPANWEDFRLKNISLDPDVDQYVFVQAAKSTSLSTGGDVSINPAYNIVMIQDGINAPAYWDGSNSVGGQSVNIPVGYWMAFSGQRLWVASSNIVLASDLGDPLSWTERVTGAGRGDFSFPRPVTGMVSYVGQNTDTRVVVFTDRATYSLASGILDRTQWSLTSNFQNTLFPTVGCIAGKSIAFQTGEMWWYSEGGLVAADVAAASYLSSQVLYKDVEMVRAKRYTPADVSKVCATSFENYLMYSIPYLEPLNSVTMVLDYAAASEWAQAKVPAWCGIWTGIRPVEWITGLVNSQSRCFAFSVDYSATADGSYNSLWEAFSPNRIDTYLDVNENGTTTTRYNRIYAQIETGLLGDGMDLKQFAYAELDAREIGGTVDLTVSFRGNKGSYQPILKTRLLALTDDYQWQNTPYASQVSELGFLNTQHRRLITESFQRDPSYSSCESSYTNDIDKSHSILVEWCGEFGVEIIRIFQDPWTEKSVGLPQAPETITCLMAQDGTSETFNLLPDPYEQPSTKPTSWYASVYQTVNNNCPSFSSGRPITATAKASYLSYVSYDDAVKNATALALQAANTAANQLRSQHPC
jgi:hypothetical protein